VLLARNTGPALDGRLDGAQAGGVLDELQSGADIAKVLSTPRIAPRLRGAAEMVSRSATVSSGFEGDSSQI